MPGPSEAVTSALWAVRRPGGHTGRHDWVRGRAGRARPAHRLSGLARAVAGGALVGLLSMGGGAVATAAAPATWSVVPISDIAEPATVSALTSVSCLSASFLYGGRVLACF